MMRCRVGTVRCRRVAAACPLHIPECPLKGLTALWRCRERVGEVGACEMEKEME